jgi:hypothetical protein
MRIFFIRITTAIFFSLMVFAANAQCSICTKTASQLGEGPAKGLNTGILYLMFAPLAIASFVGIKWWRNEKRIHQ